MTDATGEPTDHPAWAMRTWLLMALGAALGLAFHFLTRGPEPWRWTDDAWRTAGASFVAVGGLVFAFSLERLRWSWSIGFAILGGLIAASVTARNGSPSGWGSNEGWQFFSALLSVAIAVPIFQALRDEGRLSVPVQAVHYHVWSNVILGAAALAFIGASILLAFLLTELFQLIGLHFLRDLLEKRWFDLAALGATLGTAIGLLRDRDNVLGALQRVARAILSFLAPVLALGLVLFVAALPFTGLHSLWETTRATTPILLCCIAGAVILANASIGNEAEEEPKLRVLRYAAESLCAVILPLALVAAVSTGKRIGQYGYTPDRIWAAIFVAVAAAAATAYLIALVRGRAAWPAQVRRANVRLAAGICLLALLLALPIVSFGAISTRDQVARLESGRVAADRFDWRALRFDFGPSGRRALARLTASGRTPEIRTLAATALRTTPLSALADQAAPERGPQNLKAIRVLPNPQVLPAALRDTLAKGAPHCAEIGLCLLLHEPDASTAVLVAPSTCTGEGANAVLRRAGESCEPQISVYRAVGDAWKLEEPEAQWGPDAREPTVAEVQARQARATGDLAAIGANQVEIRTVQRRQVFVGGRPAGEPFE